jgi:hypothetical protein
MDHVETPGPEAVRDVWMRSFRGLPMRPSEISPIVQPQQ